MTSSMDRVADLFETEETRALLVDNLPAALALYPFSELARAVNRRDGGIPRGVQALGREFQRAGIAIHRARAADQHAQDDAVDLLTYVRSATDWWASTVDHDGPALVGAHLIDPCEAHLARGGASERDDAYAVLRALATLMQGRAGFRPQWILDVSPGL
ncbi:hypothetical protein B9W64_03840 [Streptomyces sp. CS159]|nr:hypothetical protein B9W64_03840 [Streptomyces sp. CS159]